MAASDIENEKVLIEKHIQGNAERYERLKQLDFYILDNSIRESTVGQLRSHTLENKLRILKQVKACGIRDIIVASFANMKRVDDSFVQRLIDDGEDFTNFFLVL